MSDAATSKTTSSGGSIESSVKDNKRPAASKAEQNAAEELQDEEDEDEEDEDFVRFPSPYSLPVVSRTNHSRSLRCGCF